MRLLAETDHIWASYAPGAGQPHDTTGGIWRHRAPPERLWKKTDRETLAMPELKSLAGRMAGSIMAASGIRSTTLEIATMSKIV